MLESSNSSEGDILSTAAWIRLLPIALRDRVIGECYEKSYTPRDVVAHEGEPASSWIGVIDGLLKVSTVTANGKAVMFTAIATGSWVGEGSVIKREPRRYEVLALRATRVVHVPSATFMWLLGTSLEFARHILDHLNERTGQFLEMLEVSRITDPTARVAGALGNLYNPVLAPTAGPLLNISQEEIGELAGLSRSTTNIAIAKLRKLKLVVPEYNGLLILDLARLKQFAYASSKSPSDTEN